MTNDQIGLLMFIKNMLADLIYINGIIASEVIKLTENTAAMRRGEDFLAKSTCIPEHNALNEKVIEIVKKYKTCSEDVEALETHVMKHAQKS